jgi:hypothetical protein
MKDYRTFLRLKSAMNSNQGARQGGKSTSQGYQVQHLAKHLESKVYICNDSTGTNIQEGIEEHL